MPIDINLFSSIPATNTERVLINAQNQPAKLGTLDKIGRSFSSLFSNRRAIDTQLSQENDAALAAFNQSLATRYPHANLALPLDGRALTGVRIHQSIDQANQRQQQYEANLKDRCNFNKELRKDYPTGCAARFAVPENGVALTELDKEQVRAQANLAMQTRAQSRPQELAQARQGIDRDQALTRLIDNDVSLPVGPHGALLKGTIKTGLDGILDSIYDLDRTPDKKILADLATKLGESLETHLLYAITQYCGANGIDYDNRSMQAVLEDMHVTTLNDLTQLIPGLERHLDQEVASFRTNINQLVGRLNAQGQLAEIGGRFFGGNNPTGLTGLHITNSDPHKGGNRVAILSFDNGQKLVYKPRDVRIDEKIAGAAIQGGGQSLLNAAGADALTYRFLPKDDAGGRFGFVQCLPNGSAQDHAVSQEGARQFYQDLGKLAAVLMVAGGTDIHQENIMVSNGRPFLTDLEFAFSKKVLDESVRVLRGEDDQSLAEVFGAIMLDWAITKSTDDNWATNPPRNQDGVLASPAMQTEVIENFLMVVHDDLSVHHNRDENLHREYASNFAEGVRSGLAQLRGNHQVVNDFVMGSDTLQIRYHPIDTETQRTMNGAYHMCSYQAADIGNDSQLREFAVTVGKDLLERSMRESGEPNLPLLRQHMLDSYERHDIPFFSRTVGGTQVFKDGVEDGAHTVNDYFQGNLRMAAEGIPDLIGQIADDRLAQIEADAQQWLTGLTVQKTGVCVPGSAMFTDQAHVKMLQAVRAKPQSFI